RPRLRIARDCRVGADRGAAARARHGPALVHLAGATAPAGGRRAAGGAAHLTRARRLPAMRRRSLLFVALATASALLAGACGGSSNTNDQASGTSTTRARTGCPPRSGTVESGADPFQVVLRRGKPTVTVPDQPASKLVVCDLVVGTGTAVQPGATVSVH